jgi:alkanesulfonate monooxygenase SsuD/methylene tetrahydromethanopterin reductase-like flavin-dependent oxidoreductase (luciferase family)
VDEAIGICQRLWNEEVVEHHGEFFDFGPVMFEPKPTHRPWPTLHIGGDGPAAIRRAATLGDGWIPMNHTLEQIPADAQRIARLRADAGRPGSTEITLSSGSELDDLRRMADAGIGRAIVKPWQSSKDAISSMRRFADEVLPLASQHPVTAATP